MNQVLNCPDSVSIFKTSGDRMRELGASNLQRMLAQGKNLEQERNLALEKIERKKVYLKFLTELKKLEIDPTPIYNILEKLDEEVVA